MPNPDIRVPIALRVLLVGLYPEYLWRALWNDDFSTLADDVTGRGIKSQLATTREMPKGAHLLWSLPDALTAGEQDDATDTVAFPPVPTRWLVTRTWTDLAATSGKPRVKSWIVESDALYKTTSPDRHNIGSATCAYMDHDKTQPYRFLGRAFPWDEKVAAPEGRLDGMTAIGSGDPARFAFYATSRNAFAFYDDLTDDAGKRLENVAIAYAVNGRYPDPALDPLMNTASAAACLARFNWRAPDAAAFPAACVCHGAVVGIAWRRDDTDYSEGIPGALPTPTIAVGNTSAEALAVLVESARHGDRDAARAVHHLLAGNQHALDGMDGILDAEKQLHNDRFGVWHVPAVCSLKPKSENSPAPAPFAATLLDRVNQATRDVAALARDVAEKQRSLFETWILLKQLDKEKPSKKVIDRKEACRAVLREALDDRPGGLRELLSDFAARRARLAADRQTLEQTATRDHEMAEQSEQRFFLPNNPVLLLSGVPRDFSHGEDGREADDGALKVRTDVLTAITVDAIPGVLPAATTLTAQQWLATPSFDTPDAALFVAEAALLNPAFAPCIAGNLLALAGAKAEGAALERLAEIVRDIQAARRPGLVGDAPAAIGVEPYAHPWIPLMVDWHAAYYPDPALVAESPTLTNWTRRGLDAVFSGAAIPASKKISITSRHLLTPHAAPIAAAAARRACGATLGLENLAVLSQEMAGVQEALLQETTDPALPVFDTPYGDPDLAEKAAPLLADASPTQPLFDTLFSPVRGGFLELNRVTILDAFGQFSEQKPAGCLVGEDLRYGETAFQSFIMLPPRILQPARLHFAWTRPDAPIAGLLVPNPLDASLAIFDADGFPLGSLQRVEDETRPVVWKLPPNQGGGTGELPAGLDADLRGFLDGILDAARQRRVDVLQPMLTAMDALFWQINPSSADMDPMSLYFGRPLALARGEIRLETAEPPRRFRSMGLATPVDPDVDFTQTPFPVRMGQKELHRDGLVGFFVDGDYARLHMPLEEAPADVYFSNATDVALTPNAPAPRAVSFLVDPMGDLHLDSGFLPVKTIALDRAGVAAVLAKLYHTVQAFPLLARGEKTLFPYPDVEAKRWTWLALDAQGVVREDGAVARANADAYFDGDVAAREGWLALRPNEDAP